MAIEWARENSFIIQKTEAKETKHGFPWLGCDRQQTHQLSKGDNYLLFPCTWIHWRGSYLQLLSHCQNVICPSSTYDFILRWPDQLPSLITVIQEFPLRIHIAVSSDQHPLFLNFPHIKHLFHSNSFMLRTSFILDQIPSWIFSYSYNLDFLSSELISVSPNLWIPLLLNLLFYS